MYTLSFRNRYLNIHIYKPLAWIVLILLTFFMYNGDLSIALGSAFVLLVLFFSYSEETTEIDLSTLRLRIYFRFFFIKFDVREWQSPIDHFSIVDVVIQSFFVKPDAYENMYYYQIACWTEDNERVPIALNYYKRSIRKIVARIEENLDLPVYDKTNEQFIESARKREMPN
jgi:hypothetical protein